VLRPGGVAHQFGALFRAGDLDNGNVTAARRSSPHPVDHGMAPGFPISGAGIPGGA